jgi:hypothetical protein
MPERTWVVFVVGAQAQPGRKMRVDEGSPVVTVKERVLSGRREHIVWAEGGSVSVAFARRKRWQVEVLGPLICS